MSRNDLSLKRSQIEVLAVAEGFFQSNILFALTKLKIFEFIGNDRKHIGQIAAYAGIKVERLSRLLNAGVVLKMLESVDGAHYTAVPSFQAVLSDTASEYYLGNWIRNLELFQTALASLDRAVSGSVPPVDPFAYVGGDKYLTREYVLAMHNYASLRGKELADFLDIGSTTTLLDLGCGPGTYAFNLGQRHPGLVLNLLDLPDVLEIAKELQAHYAVKNRVNYIAMDALKDDIPGSYDMVLVSNTLHMLGEDACRELIKRLFSSVNRGGSIVIQAQYMQDDMMGGRWPIFLDLIQLCTTDKGRNHSVSETKKWMEDAGFRKMEYCRMTLLNTNGFLRAYRD